MFYDRGLKEWNHGTVFCLWGSLLQLYFTQQTAIKNQKLAGTSHSDYQEMKL